MRVIGQNILYKNHTQVCENGSYNLFKTSHEFPLTKDIMTLQNDFLNCQVTIVS